CPAPTRSSSDLRPRPPSRALDRRPRLRPPRYARGASAAGGTDGPGMARQLDWSRPHRDWDAAAGVPPPPQRRRWRGLAGDILERAAAQLQRLRDGTDAVAGGADRGVGGVDAVANRDGRRLRITG